MKHPNSTPDKAVQSSAELKDRVPSPPPIQRVVRWHHVFSPDDDTRSNDDLEVGLVEVPIDNRLNSETFQQDHPTMPNQYPRPMVSLFTDAYQQQSLSFDYPTQHQSTNLGPSFSHDEYYSMGEHSLELHHEQEDTMTGRSPLVFPIALVAALLLLLGVIFLYGAEGSSHD